MLVKLISDLIIESQKLIKRIKRGLRSRVLIPQFKSCGPDTRFSKIGLLKGFKNIQIGNSCFFEDFIYLTAISGKRKYNLADGTEKHQFFSPSIIIGDRCAFGAFNHLTCCNQIIIGDNLLTGKWVTITDNAHGDSSLDCLGICPLRRYIVSKGPIVIGDNVWIGEKATILPGVQIGDGAVIAANAVVTRDVPAYSVVAGVPAVVVYSCKK